MSDYKHNHYVPVWYQRRFMLPDQRRYYRLRPDVINTEKGKYTRNDVHHWSPERIFAIARSEKLKCCIGFRPSGR
jgi:hypothetical protein